VDIGAVITETKGMADDEPCDALGIRLAVAKTPATAKTALTASQEARHLNLRRDPESTGTTPLCLPPLRLEPDRTHFLEPAKASMVGFVVGTAPCDHHSGGPGSVAEVNPGATGTSLASMMAARGQCTRGVN
jgi:hypothetical protein